MCACSPNSGAETEDLSPGVQTQARQHCEMQGVDNGDWRLDSGCSNVSYRLPLGKEQFWPVEHPGRDFQLRQEMGAAEIELFC